MTDLDLAAIKARAEAATEGPWAWASAPAEGSNETAAEYLEKALTDDGPLFVVWVPATQGASEGYRLTASTGDGPHASMDAEFIAHARQDIPALLAYIDELEAQVERVRLKAKVEAFMDAQQIIAGEDPIDEMRYHDGSKVSIGHTIREIDVEIRELALGGDDE